jgi:pyruvate dehydrogenase E2 component (dihydrolipoamide acetyltransferase)
MAELITMPKLSDTMTEGVVAQWHKKVGDTVKSNEVIAEIETDKATMDFESPVSGVLLYIGVDKGQTAPINAPLCIIGKQGEDIAALLASAQAPKKEEAKKEEPKKETAPVAEEKKAEPVAATKTETPKAPVTATAPKVQSSTTANGRLKASPLAKKLAQDKGLNIALVKGSGEGGRIVKRDIDTFSGGQMMVPQEEQFTEVAVSQMRKTIARRLAESKFSAPHFYLTIDLDMDRAIDTRKSIADTLGVKISYNDMVIKAVSLALTEHPAVNSAWLGDRIRYNQHVHIGVAVAVDEGLLVPVVQFANSKTLSQISAEVKEYATRAKSKKLQPAEMEGSTFSVSNLGMFGIEEFTAIINPPNACILAIGAIRETPVVKNGQIVPGNRMKVTLSCDHRVVDGATGAAFLQTFKNLMENPVIMLGKMSI